VMADEKLLLVLHQQRHRLLVLGAQMLALRALQVLVRQPRLQARNARSLKRWKYLLHASRVIAMAASISCVWRTLVSATILRASIQC